ncbi:MAG: type II toxin-antitoxin system HicA family toxin [bacterium]
MSINYNLLRSLTARELITALIKDDFYLRNQRGSHQRYRNSDGRRVTVSFHKTSDNFPPKTLKTIIEDQARWTEYDVKKMGLIK